MRIIEMATPRFMDENSASKVVEILREEMRGVEATVAPVAAAAARVAEKFAADQKRLAALAQPVSGIAIPSIASALAMPSMATPISSIVRQLQPAYAQLFKPSAFAYLTQLQSPVLASLEAWTRSPFWEFYAKARPISFHPFASHGARVFSALTVTDIADLRSALGLWHGIGRAQDHSLLALAFLRASANRIAGGLSARARAALQWGLRTWRRFFSLLRRAGAGASFVPGLSPGGWRRLRDFRRRLDALHFLTFSIQRHGPPLCLA